MPMATPESPYPEADPLKSTRPYPGSPRRAGNPLAGGPWAGASGDLRRAKEKLQLRNWGKALLRVLWAVVVYAALTACALAAVNLYAKSVLPFYRWELGLIAPEYQVENLDLETALAQPAFGVKARNSDSLSDIGASFPAHSLVFQFQFLVTQGLAHVVMLLFVPLAWPGYSWKRRAAALSCAIPILCLVESADVPWALVGGLDAVKSRFVQASDSLPMIWLHITASGGSFALGLAGGALACQMSAFFENSSPRKSRKSGKGSAPRRRTKK